MTEVLQVVTYLAAVFNAQWTYVTYKGDFGPITSVRTDENAAKLENATIPLRDWIFIEYYTFYVYMGSAIFFIARHQIKNWYNDYHKNDRMISDIKKRMTDFIVYEETSIEWFCLNLVCVILPPIVVLSVLIPLNWEFTTSTIVMTSLIGAQWVGHVLQVCLNSSLYVYDKPKVVK